jgi:DNA-binding NtrC family response regulator
MNASVQRQPALLFVDDDVGVLSALRHFFRREAEIWDLVFIEGGVAAIAHLESHFVDVVMSDFQMPIVNGGLVLATAATLQPRAIRILCTASSVSAAAVNADILLSKPFNARELRATLAAAVSAPLANDRGLQRVDLHKL